MIKIWKVQDMYYLAQKEETTVQELAKNNEILFSRRGSVSLKEFPMAILLLDITSVNGGNIIEANANGKKVGEFKRISWSKEELISEDDTWEVSIDTDLVENKDEVESMEGLVKA